MEVFFMNIIGGFKLLITSIVLVLIFTTASNAWADPISIRYAGTGFDTTVDNLDDGLPANLSLADAKGSFGASKVEVSAEFLYQAADCKDGYDVELGIFYVASVTTFESGNQLFGFSNQGWMCLNTDNGHYYGHVDGLFGGGTGKFAGATGEWMTDFDGQNLEPASLIPVGFRSIAGVIKGNVVFP